MTPAQNNSLKHAVISILVFKRSKWICRETLYSLATPGHLLSPQLFLNYRHIIDLSDIFFTFAKQLLLIGIIFLLFELRLCIFAGDPFFRLRKIA